MNVIAQMILAAFLIAPNTLMFGLFKETFKMNPVAGVVWQFFGVGIGAAIIALQSSGDCETFRGRTSN